MKQRLSLEELSTKDGTKGKPALVAVGGKVHDLSSSKMWQNGRHVNTHKAGQDLTFAIQAAPHGPEVLERFEIVGELTEKAPQPVLRELLKPSPLIRWVLSHHPHPILVHFPIALGVATSVFTLLALIFSVTGMAEATVYNLIFAAATAPLAAGAGLLSWRYNYGGRWTPIFRAKLLLSIILILVLAVAVITRLVYDIEDTGTNTATTYVYYVLAIGVAANVLALGRLGGKITFPG